MRFLQGILIIWGAMSLTVQAQTWSQPVREVEKSARTAVTGNCNDVEVYGGQISSNVVQCNFYPVSRVSEAELYTRVPAGKVLVVEDLSVRCYKHNSDGFSGVFFNTGNRKYIPLQLQSTASGTGRQIYVSSLPVTMYAPAGERVTSSFTMMANANQHASCFVSYYGHLVDLQ